METSPSINQPQHRPLWLVHEVTVLAHWLDEFTMAWAALFVGIVGGMVALDSLTHIVGNSQLLMTITGICAAIGIETQGRTMIRRGKKAADERRGWPAFGYFLSAAPILFILFELTWMFMLQRSFNMTETQAVYAIGMTPERMTFIRAAVFIYVVFLTGFAYYTRPKVTINEKVSKMREDAILAREEADLIAAQQVKRDAQLAAMARNGAQARNAAIAAIKGKVNEVPGATRTPPAIDLGDIVSVSAVDGAYANRGIPSMSVARASDFNGDDEPPTPPTGGGLPTRAPVSRGRSSGSLSRGRPSLPVSAYSQDVSLNSVTVDGATISDLKEFLLRESARFAQGQRDAEPTQQEALRYLQDGGYSPRAVTLGFKAALKRAYNELSDSGDLAWETLSLTA